MRGAGPEANAKARLTWSALQPVHRAVQEIEDVRIGSFAARSGLSPDTIRYYERIGLMPRPPRDGGGRRDYGSAELAWAAFLYKLQVMDMPIRDRLAYGRLRAEGDGTVQARLEILKAHRSELIRRQAEIADCVAILDAKINHYRGMDTGTGDPHHEPEPTRNDHGCRDRHPSGSGR